VGQWIFAAYQLAFYGGAAARGELDRWNEVLSGGIVAGDPPGNVAVVLHIVSSVILTVFGALQVMPQVRERLPRFHRWNGRVFIVTAFIGALTGIFMIFTRGTVGGPLQHLGTASNGLAIMLCATLAVRHAIARRIGEHRRWALRTFLVVNGVWFFRVGLMFWLAVNQGPVGFDADTFSGPFLVFLAFAEYLLPLLVLEGYLRMCDGGSARGRYAMAGVLVLMTAVTGIGIATATIGMWLPRM